MAPKRRPGSGQQPAPKRTRRARAKAKASPKSRSNLSGGAETPPVSGPDTPRTDDDMTPSARGLIISEDSLGQEIT